MIASTNQTAQVLTAHAAPAAAAPDRRAAVFSPTAAAGRDYLSWSAISTYRGCPLRYYFRYVARLPEPMVAASLVFGGAIHAAIEHWFNRQQAGVPQPALDELLEKYHAAWFERADQEIRFGQQEDENSLDRLAVRVLAAFTRSDVARPAGRVVGVEQELRGAIVPGCPDLLARLDLVVEEPAAVLITDFKTSRSRWSLEQVASSAEQLLFYHELADQIAPEKEVKLRFAVFTKTKEPVCEVHAVPVDWRASARLRKIVQRVWRSIEAGHFYPAPSPINCSGCPFQEPCRSWRG